MVRTRGYATKDEATEAWNTWAGSTVSIDRAAFNNLNEAVDRDYPIEHGRGVLPDGKHAFGDLEIVPDAGYEHPWPRIYLADFSNCEAGLYGDDSMRTIYKLRARWRLVERDHRELRRQVAELLMQNDRENKLLNAQTSQWNSILAGSGFPLFEENDIRGVDVSGLVIVPGKREHVWLRGVDLSYAEAHLLQIPGANLYGAKCVGIKAVQADLSRVVACGTSFRGAYMLEGRFSGADVGFCDFRGALLSHCDFGGACCNGADFSSATLYRASFDSYTDPQSGHRTFSDLSGVTWDDDTRFAEMVFSDVLPDQNRRLAEHVRNLRAQGSVKQELVSSVEVKPGAFGVAVDLVRLAHTLRRLWGRARKTTRDGHRRPKRR